MSGAVRHPATFSSTILDCIAESIDAHVPIPSRRWRNVLDPFGGVGTIHELRGRCEQLGTWSIEIEPEWSIAGRERYPIELGDTSAPCISIIEDCRVALRGQRAASWDVIATSPCYGNRMADKHEATDACKRCRGTGWEPATPSSARRDVRVVRAHDWSLVLTTRRTPLDGDLLVDTTTTCSLCAGSKLSPRRSYRHDLGRMPSEGSAAIMQWGDEYRAFHADVWQLVYRALRPGRWADDSGSSYVGGIFALNIKDHVRGGRLQRVPQWHLRTCREIGFELIETWRIPQRGLQHGANRERATNELVYVFGKAA